MEAYRITGGNSLRGSVQVPAAKNSVLPLLAAACLCEGRVYLCGVPRLTDVEISLKLLRAVGAKAEWQGEDVMVDAAGVFTGVLPKLLAEAMRSSVFYLAPLLVRTGQVQLPMPGGCKLGPRPVDIHLDGLVKMGARLRADALGVSLSSPSRLRGVDYTLRLPSVGATETLLMAAVTARGITLLRGAACEPEIVDLADFLTACGAIIHGAGTPVIVITGVPALSGCRWTPIPDRIYAGTLGAAVALASGEITVTGCRPTLWAPMLQFLTGCGCQMKNCGSRVTLSRTGPLTGGVELCTGAWPAFATDWAPLAAAVLLAAQGGGQIYDGIFANRFACATGFAALGGRVRAEGHRLRLEGNPGRLQGAELTAPDLRGGAALLLAALAAQGDSLLRDEGHIRRGYADLPGQLRALGADIRPETAAKTRKKCDK